MPKLWDKIWDTFVKHTWLQALCCGLFGLVYVAHIHKNKDQKIEDICKETFIHTDCEGMDTEDEDISDAQLIKPIILLKKRKKIFENV